HGVNGRPQEEEHDPRREERPAPRDRIRSDVFHDNLSKKSDFPKSRARSKRAAHFRAPGSADAAFGLAAVKSSPSRAAMVAATWLCVVSTFSRTPSAGVSGPSTAIQMNSASGTFLA